MSDDASASDENTREAGSVEPDELFTLLADGRRRCVLYCLQTYGSPMGLPDLADEVAAWERDTSLEGVSADAVKHVYMSLYHTHIPLLTDAGIVGYDQETDAVALRDGFETVRPHLDRIDESL